jgi:MFS superfamily sulfate permease-like transporter
VTLLVVLAATIVVGVFDLSASAGVQVLGAMPQGLPAFVLPHVNSAELGAIVIGGIEIAVVSFADSSILSRAYAAKTTTFQLMEWVVRILGVACHAQNQRKGWSLNGANIRSERK